MPPQKGLKPITSYKEKTMSDNQQDSFMKECIERAKNFTLDKKFLEREYVARYRFKTKNSGDIKYSLMVMAEENIDRDRARNMIKQYVGFDHIAYEIERGLFEFKFLDLNITLSRTSTRL